MKNTQNQFKLRQLLTLQKTLWGLAWLLGIVTVLSVLGLVMVAGWFISMAAVAGVVAVGLHTFNYLMPSAIIRLFAITRTAARYGDLMVSHHAVFGLLKQLRVAFFSRWATLPFLARSNAKSSSQTMQRLVKDIDTLDEFVLRIVSPWVVATTAVLALVAVLLWLLPHGWVALFLLLTLLVAYVVLRLGVALAKQESRLVHQRKSKLLDALPAITQLLIWQQWLPQTNQMTQLDAAHHQLMQKTHNLRRWGGFVMQLVIALVVVAVLALANELFVANRLPIFTADTINEYAALNPAMVLALVLGLFGVIEIVVALVGEPLALGHSIHAKNRLNELVCYDDKTPPKTPLPDSAQPLTLRLCDVCVKLPSAIVSTTQISATLDSQRPTLIVGASGAGKSTLLMTLAGEIEPVSGQITLNGTDYTKMAHGQSLGFLGQTVDIFDQTLADNLRLGKPSASDDELLAVLDKVGLLSWLNAQPKGLATPLGEYGMAISGGQARRIALARLLLTPKAILLLDEPFAGLDGNTRQKVWDSLLAMQQQGDIGILAIATHQVWEQMCEADRIVIT